MRALTLQIVSHNIQKQHSQLTPSDQQQHTKSVKLLH